MRTHSWLYPSVLVLASLGASESVHPHASYPRGLLQTAPAFSSEDIEMHPALHPEHDPHDLQHLVPESFKTIHYSQEGHKPALHGAKHTRIDATFGHPTVILDHSRNVTKVKCHDRSNGRTEQMKVCFSSPEAMQKAQDSWRAVNGPFNVATYHTGCGDRSGRKRSFFRATQPVAAVGKSCLTVPAYPIREPDAIHAADVSVGTYTDPTNRRRESVKGHVGILPGLQGGVDGRANGNQGAVNGALEGVDGLRSGQQQQAGGEGNVDLTTNKAELEKFVHSPLDLTAQDQYTDGPIHFVNYDGTVSKRAIAPDSGGFSWWGWIEDAVSTWVKDLLFGEGDFKSRVARAWQKIKDVVHLLLELAAIPFGSPFERTYNFDIEPEIYAGPLGEAGKPKNAWDNIGNGWMFGEKGIGAKVECIKCGFEGHFNIQAQFSFDIVNGLTKGSLNATNQAPAKVEAQMALTVDGKVSKEKEVFKAERVIQKKKIRGIVVKDIFDLGLLAVAKASVTASAEGSFKFLFGGTLDLSEGTIFYDLTGKEANKLVGLKPKLTPTFKSDETTVSLTLEAGIPVGIEGGVTIFNGAYGKTVGAYITPSLYGTAIFTDSKESECKGMEFRMGTKIRSYFAALDLFEWELFEFKVFEYGIFCWGNDEFSFKKVNKPVLFEFSGKIGELLKAGEDGPNTLPDAEPEPLQNLEPKPIEDASPGTFRVVGDDSDKYIVMTGQDGGIYLVDKNDQNDISAPLGTLDEKTDFLAFDIFGRIMHYSDIDAVASSTSVLPLRVTPPKIMPKNQTITALARLQDDSNNYGVYAVPQSLGTGKNTKVTLFYPTVCETELGLRLVATRDIVDKNTASIEQPAGTQLGVLSEEPQPWEVPAGLRLFGFDPAKCRSVKLNHEKEVDNPDDEEEE